ncbi:MAG: holo-ACP synthase [Deltaproteobacteria bacterium]|nr:holo-ACP synthase [Deltaproteobacteria bacterium]
MIYGIGVDLVHVPRMEDVLDRWGDRFLDRVYTPAERALCLSRARPASAFALRFAAKEAFSKAIGLGMRQGVRWRDIEIFHHAGGRPGMRVCGKCRDICCDRGITSMHVSLSDERDYATAMVVLEAGDPAGKSGTRRR